MTDTLTRAQMAASAYAAAGVDLPADAARAFALRDALAQAAFAERSVEMELRDAIEAGELTADNAAERLRDAALTMALRDGTKALLYDLNGVLGRQALRALRDDAPRLVGAVRDRHAAAAAVVLDWLAHHPAAAFADADHVLAKGAAKLWAATGEALAELDAIHYLLAGVGAEPPLAVSLYVDLTADAKPGALHGAQQAFSTMANRWLHVYAVPGIVPALHDPDGVAAVLARARALDDAPRRPSPAERAALARQSADAKRWTDLVAS